MQFEELRLVLERIAVALEAPAQPAPAPVPDVADVGCQHPERFRVTFGSPDEYECASPRGGCGYRSDALKG